ncbi:MAG: peptidoglycan DD-metalloendopeptidase family protein [Pirellulales bacterium]|nr:peptidoglycan DD-metalloendopeptidase family protein [Pirellulales bacterium]
MRSRNLIITVLAGVLFAFSSTSLLAQNGMRPSNVQPVGPVYSLPYEPGATFLVGQGYLEFPTHEGIYAIDWLMPEETPIVAARAGVIVEVVDSFSQSGMTEDMKQKGNFVRIQHDDGSRALYYHLAQNGAKVKVGQRVEEGQRIALSGNTGFSATPHLHFEVDRPENGKYASVPTLFKSGTDEPFDVVRGGKYTAPGGKDPSERTLADKGPLQGVKGTGELSSIRPRMIAMVRAEKDPQKAATLLKRHLLDHRAEYHKKYKDTFAKSRTGDKPSMKELGLFLDDMDLQSQPDVARLLVDPASANTANEALMIWWELYSP